MRNTKLVTLLIMMVISSNAFSQEETPEIDPSKPTNLYTQFNALGEFTSADNYNLYGTRFNIQYAFNPDNLLLVEVPILYNDATNKLGLSDTRIRYFNVVKRNISPKLIAIAPFLDVSIPTGSAKNGLGSDTWSLAAGAVVGLIVSKNVSLFPGINYVYLTKPEESGFGLQTNMSVNFSKKSFIFVNPVITFFSFDTIVQAELNYNYIITPSKFKVNAGWYPNFTNEIHTFRVGATLYL